MRDWRAAAVCCLLIWSAAATAEEGGSAAATAATPAAATAATASAEPAPARVEEAQPSLYYLKDKQGNLQAVPNFSFEDFEQLYRLKYQLAQGDQRPRYTIQQITANGTADAEHEHAELTIRFRILVREEQWLRVPLHLDRAVLREQPQYQGPGRAIPALRGR